MEQELEGSTSTEVMEQALKGSTSTEEMEQELKGSTVSRSEFVSLEDIKNQISVMAANLSGYKKADFEEEYEKITKAFNELKKRNVNQSSNDQSPTPQLERCNEGQQINEAGGYSFKICDMMLLKRFLVIGSESGSYYADGTTLTNENISCVNRLIEKGHGLDVLEVLEDYSIKGRVAKEESILLSLAHCALSPQLNIQKAAYEKVVKICNIPTKLFLFLDYCQNRIDDKRKTNPPTPQLKRKRPKGEHDFKDLEVNRKIPTENENTDHTPRKRKKQSQDGFKKVNKEPKKSSGWGRMRRRGISAFYTDPLKEPERLLYLLTKYKQRNDWSHKQVLGYAHPKMSDEDDDIKKAKNFVLTFATRGYETFKKCTKDFRNDEGKLFTSGVNEKLIKIMNYIDILNDIIQLDPMQEEHLQRLLDYLKNHGIRTERFENSAVYFGQSEPQNKDGKRSAFQIVREHIPTGFLKKKVVWEALLEDMPMHALIRNLGKMSSMGLFGTDDANSNNNVKLVENALLNTKRLKLARLHPMKILIALHVYQRGSGIKGDLTWEINPHICDYLDQAFYLSFLNDEVKEVFKTNKNYMLCLDVSGSMTWKGCYGCEMITPAMASVAMAMITWNIEDNVDIMAFGGHFESLHDRLNKSMKLEEAMKATSHLDFGATDCSLPMIYAKENRKKVDVFIVYTDSDTWSDHIHPHEALKEYNVAMKTSAKLIVCAMQSNEFSIADPSDPNMLDVCGFDASVPDIISTFSKGNLSEKCNVCEQCKEFLAQMHKLVEVSSTKCLP